MLEVNKFLSILQAIYYGQRKMRAYRGWFRSLVTVNSESHLVEYADDVSGLVTIRTVEHAQRTLGTVIWPDNKWIAEHGISLALEKTEYVFLNEERVSTVLLRFMNDRCDRHEDEFLRVNS